MAAHENQLTVVSIHGARVTCLCSCGRSIEIPRSALKGRKSCGCRSGPRPFLRKPDAHKKRLHKLAKVKSLYGMSPDEFTDRVENATACDSCGGPFDWRGPRIDHAHSKPKTWRGILCDACNTIIGLAGESPDKLRKAADYLERHQ